MITKEIAQKILESHPNYNKIDVPIEWINMFTFKPEVGAFSQSFITKKYLIKDVSDLFKIIGSYEHIFVYQLTEIDNLGLYFRMFGINSSDYTQSKEQIRKEVKEFVQSSDKVIYTKYPNFLIDDDGVPFLRKGTRPITITVNIGERQSGKSTLAKYEINKMPADKKIGLFVPLQAYSEHILRRQKMNDNVKVFSKFEDARSHVFDKVVIDEFTFIKDSYEKFEYLFPAMRGGEIVIFTDSINHAWLSNFSNVHINYLSESCKPTVYVESIKLSTGLEYKLDCYSVSDEDINEFLIKHKK